MVHLKNKKNFVLHQKRPNLLPKKDVTDNIHDNWYIYICAPYIIYLEKNTIVRRREYITRNVHLSCAENEEKWARQDHWRIWRGPTTARRTLKKDPKKNQDMYLESRTWVPVYACANCYPLIYYFVKCVKCDSWHIVLIRTPINRSSPYILLTIYPHKRESFGIVIPKTSMSIPKTFQRTYS